MGGIRPPPGRSGKGGRSGGGRGRGGGGSSSSPVAAAATRMRCELGGKCFKEDPAHKREFAHPHDDDWDEAREPPKQQMWSCEECDAKSPMNFKFCSKCMTPQPARALARAEEAAAAAAAEAAAEGEKHTQTQPDPKQQLVLVVPVPIARYLVRLLVQFLVEPKCVTLCAALQLAFRHS